MTPRPAGEPAARARAAGGPMRVAMHCVRRRLSQKRTTDRRPEGVTPLLGVLLVPGRHRVYTPDDERVWDLADVAASLSGASVLTLVDGDRSRTLPVGPRGRVLGIDTRPGTDAADSIARQVAV